MWADLTESIEQLRGMFLDTNSKDDESSQHDDSPSFCDAESPNPGSSGPNAAILGYRSLAHSLRDFHPSVELSMRLFQLFNDNVLPVVRIFHTQTLIRLFWSAVVKPDSIDKETEALLFAIYYSAIVSITPDQCANVVGEPRSSVIERYKFAAEQALARANLLNTHSTLLLQAAVLYVSVLRSEDGTRTVWSLIALTSHVARSMGFHRDGTFFNLPPFETEMRRRIWHHICLLDHRSTEYHGYEPTVVDETAFDTRWPLNVNDSDLSSDMTGPPSESIGSTEMTLTRTRCHALRISRKMKRQSRSPFPERVKIVDEYDEWVEKYVERCDPAQPLLYLSNEISYIIAARFRAVTYYHELLLRKKREEANASRTKNDRITVEASQGRSEVEPDNKTLRDQLFAAAVTILGRTVSIMQDPRLDRWAWHSHIYVQWQTIALVLSEICIRPPSPLCDAAWEHVSAIYDRWLCVKFRDGTERGDDFLKPIGQLIAKTQGVRSLQQAQQQARQQAQQHHYPTQTQTATPGAGGSETPGQRMLYDTPGNQTSSLNLDGLDTMCVDALSHQADLDLAATTASPSAISGNDPPLYEIIGFDPFLEMLPDELQNVWYESVARDNSNLHNDAPETKPFFDFP
ncbi:hypothetical protein NUW58_g8557 [Xylaria curta]|uniref:Uncharacterized protein n=1 Tax=Xylaria curta TaxID=42375 RepID=A0ACC1N7I3_9PEZI|nr:hypothetical protein NUW58_g8557 [Xylaria curta]